MKTEKPVVICWVDWKIQHEEIDPVSLTVPGEAMTVRQIFERHRAGIIDGIQQNGQFDEDEEFISPDRIVSDQFDLTTIDEVKQSFENAKEIQKKVKAIKEKDESKKTTERTKIKESEEVKKDEEEIKT